MAFKKKTWSDRVSEYPTRRTLTKTDGSTEVVTVERNEGNVSAEGDAFSGANMNDMEDRIDDAFTEVNDFLDKMIEVQLDCDSDLIGKEISMSDGKTTLTAKVDATLKIVFDLPNLGTWTLYNSATGASEVYECKSYGIYTGYVSFYKKYTVLIDFSKSDPKAMCSYSDNAEGHDTGYDAWKNETIFACLKNCLLLKGEVLGYLDKDNLAKYENGNVADITTLENDVMLEIGRRLGYLIEWESATVLRVSVTDNPNDDDYNYDAFSLDDYNDCDKIYIGTFKGYASGSKLYSSSGKSVTVSQTIDTFRTYARARGTGYQQRSYGSLKLMQCLYLIMYKDLDSQTEVGYGYVNSSHSAGVTTGNTNSYGFCSEIIKASTPSYMTDQNHQVKCLGIEDFWGNYWEFIEGVCTDASRNILTCKTAAKFDTDGTGYENNGNGGVTSNIGNYMHLPQGGSNSGFTPVSVDGSSTTYFCDCTRLYASCLAIFGGAWSNAAYAGVFLLNLNSAFTLSSTNVGARLMYLHKEDKE